MARAIFRARGVLSAPAACLRHAAARLCVFNMQGVMRGRRAGGDGQRGLSARARDFRLFALGVVASSRHADRRQTRPLPRRLGAMHGRPLAHSDGARARQEATTVGWSAAPRWSAPALQRAQRQRHAQGRLLNSRQGHSAAAVAALSERARCRRHDQHQDAARPTSHQLMESRVGAETLAGAVCYMYIVGCKFSTRSHNTQIYGMTDIIQHLDQ